MVVSAGVLLLVTAAVSAVQTSRFIAGSLQGDGTVTRLNAGGSHPQVAFRTRAGSIVSVPQGGLITGFRVGQPVQVLYAASDPARTVRLRSFGSLWGTSLTLAILGAGLLGLGLASFSLRIEFHPTGR